MKRIKEVSTAERVAGPYDIIARIEADSVESLSRVVFAELRSMAGVTNATVLFVIEAG